MRLLILLGLVVLVARSVNQGRQPIRWWFNPSTTQLVDQLGVDPPGAGFRPASDYEIGLYISGGNTL